LIYNQSLILLRLKLSVFVVLGFHQLLLQKLVHSDWLIFFWHNPQD
uniref:Ovule protein n=1 Tax=Strongyloides papillosus TaxID=174720 RepID=A0A0N5BXQ1_STREA